MAVESDVVEVERLTTALGYLRLIVASLTSLLALSLLMVGVVAVIAELKGTWHWAIHLETTISYARLVVGWLLAALVPTVLALVVGRWVVADG